MAAFFFSRFLALSLVGFYPGPLLTCIPFYRTADAFCASQSNLSLSLHAHHRFPNNKRSSQPQHKFSSMSLFFLKLIPFISRVIRQYAPAPSQNPRFCAGKPAKNSNLAATRSHFLLPHTNRTGFSLELRKTTPIQKQSRTQSRETMARIIRVMPRCPLCVRRV